MDFECRGPFMIDRDRDQCAWKWNKNGTLKSRKDC